MPTPRNRRDFDEIPAEARAHPEFIWLGRVDQAIESAFGLPEDLAPG